MGHHWAWLVLVLVQVQVIKVFSLFGWTISYIGAATEFLITFLLQLGEESRVHWNFELFHAIDGSGIIGFAINSRRFELPLAPYIVVGDSF